jgi:hypothetical protein
MAYTALHSDTGNLTGLTTPIDYGSGVEYVLGLTSMYPNTAIQLGLYLVDSCEAINRGSLDQHINQLGHFIKSINVTVYLRIGE